LRGEPGTTLSFNLPDGQSAINISPSGGPTPPTLEKKTYKITKFVPSGSTSFLVASVTGLKQGDQILITQPTSKNWIASLEMDQLYRNDGRGEPQPQTWLGSIRSKWYREIQSVALDGTVTVTVPLSDSLEPQITTFKKIVSENTISDIGLESIQIKATSSGIKIGPTGVDLDGVVDAWMTGVDFEFPMLKDKTQSFIKIGRVRRMTIYNSKMLHAQTLYHPKAAKPAFISCSGSQILLQKCSAKGDSDSFFFVTQSTTVGPNVVYNCKSTLKGALEPHQRWATGLLVDNCNIASGIHFINRGHKGGGHGWAIGWGVAWNCTSDDRLSDSGFLTELPTGSANWVIGCVGPQKPQKKYPNDPPGPTARMPVGIYDSHGTQIAIRSLFCAQLTERRTREPAREAQPEGLLSQTKKVQDDLGQMSATSRPME